jgi:ribonucleoside-triphosphate reductase (thioredoxin)
VDAPKNVVVEIPINAGAGVRKATDISMWEQLSLAAFLQKYWADNQVRNICVAYGASTFD